MEICLILAHPRPGSLNHAIAETAHCCLGELGHVVNFHDLYAEGFDPRLPAAELGEASSLPEAVARHCRELARAEGIVVVHPNWWGMPPAILVGWLDRVLRPGVAYRFLEGDGGEGVPQGLLKARAAVVYNTSNTQAQREQEVFGDPLERIWRDCIFGLCGVQRFHRRMFRVVVTSSLAQRRGWLTQVREDLARIFPPGD